MNAPLLRRALLIGTEHYHDPRFARLPSTRADTARLAAVLGDRAIGGFDVEVRSDLDATGMRSAIDTFCRERGPDELALIYISGHGLRGPDGEFVFVAVDTDRDHPSETGVSAGFVNRCVEGCFADQKIAVLDTCDSGAFAFGLRTTPTKGTRMAPVTHSPVTPRGVYVLASSDATQVSYSGRGTVAEPEPSVFTGAIVDVLSSGAAGASSSGTVSVEDLFTAVADRLRLCEPPQSPVKSTVRVSGAIAIAARPGGGIPRPVVGAERRSTTGIDHESGGVPDWNRLLAYYIDVVRAEVGEPPLLPVRGGTHIIVPGRERALLGDVDADGCISVPPRGESVLAAANSAGTVLYLGWPAVLVYGEPGRKPWRMPKFAPLLMRRVNVESGPDGPRLRPEGPIVPHPGLAQLLLGEEEARHLTATYLPTWHQGESARMAQDAAQLLADTFGLGCVEELRPGRLSEVVTTATSGAGARNAAVFFAIEPNTATRNLLKDLEWINGRVSTIARTALAALYPGGPGPRPVDAPPEVTPLAANAAQRSVLFSAMTQGLTVATGPPGTGKSQLVVDAVATAVAAGQSVLVASTNGRAVDEIHERCERLFPGLVLRTGSVKARPVEASGLESLLNAQWPSPRTRETREYAARTSARRAAALHEELTAVAVREAELLSLWRRISALRQALGLTVADPGQWVGADWGDRARTLAGAWLFGERRRRRFLARIDLHPTDTARSCAGVADLAQLEQRWRLLRDAAIAGPSDEELSREQATCREATTRASLELVAGAVADRAVAGRAALARLWQARDEGGGWNELDEAFPYLRGWAVTSLSARRFPTRPGLFDLVIVDEASQCTIPSIVPLLYRARRALIIGDAMQLPHISTLDARTDGALRRAHSVPRDWLADRRLSPVRHSAFAAAERVVGTPLLLDEHYRCHPDIAEVPNRLFYQGRLTVLTDITPTGDRPAVGGPAIAWRDVRGRAERGDDGTSWCNRDEADDVARCVEELVAALPPTATIGVVTPYRPQADAVRARLGKHTDRVRVGTAHAFQGGERDVMVLSLVAAANQPPRSFDWADQQPELWNVAITRARSRLIIVGDAAVWVERGRVGGELLRAASSTSGPTFRGAPDQPLADLLYDAMAAIPGAKVELGVFVNGHRADAVVTTPSGPRPVLLDVGTAVWNDPATHLSRMLQRRALLGGTARRVPAWLLHDGAAAQARLLDS